jgi:NAD(P)-dependent dehydrogenase (short-subunit alcohol dehydrogenase family)
MKGLALLSLEGKRALVTGAGTGLGQTIARAFSEAGADVVITGRRRAPLEETAASIVDAGGTVEIIESDVTNEDDVQRLKAGAGQIDILVNNAGIAPNEPWDTVPLDSWRDVLEVNLLAPFRLCQVFAPPMAERGWGRIINIASVYGSIAGKPHHYPPDWDPSSYFGSKHGVHGITRYLAVRLAPHGVCVNSLSPGGVAGATNAGLTAKEQASLAASRTAEEARFEAERGARFLHDEIPMGRSGEPDDYAGPAVFLASPGAKYITGQLVIVDGGWTVW